MSAPTGDIGGVTHLEDDTGTAHEFSVHDFRLPPAISDVIYVFAKRHAGGHLYEILYVGQTGDPLHVRFSAHEKRDQATARGADRLLVLPWSPIKEVRVKLEKSLIRRHNPLLNDSPLASIKAY